MGEKNLNSFKSKISPTKNPDKTPIPDPTPESTPHLTVVDTPKPTNTKIK